MTNLLGHNLSINLNQQRLTCILDPSLALNFYGLSIARSLSEFLDLWLVREFCQILENINFYQQHPESLLLTKALTETSNIPTHNRQEIIQTLQDWENVRQTTAPTKLNLFWIGDKPSESFLPNNLDSELISQWEFFAHSLDDQLDSRCVANSTLNAAFRDTAALAATLKSAFILTYQPPENNANNLDPEICTTLESWSIPCQKIDSYDTVAAIERENFLHLIIQAGLSKFLWAGLNLAILHLIVPYASSSRYIKPQLLNQQNFNQEGNLPKSLLNFNIWRKARGFWYQIKN